MTVLRWRAIVEHVLVCVLSLLALLCHRFKHHVGLAVAVLYLYSHGQSILIKKKKEPRFVIVLCELGCVSGAHCGD